MFSPSPFLTNSGDSHKKFNYQFHFFSSTNILAAEVTTVRLSVDCVGSGRIVLFAPIGRASHHLSRSHFSTWVVKMCPQSNPCCSQSPSSGNASLPECVNKRVGNKSLCAKLHIYMKTSDCPRKGGEKLYATNTRTEYMWHPHQGKELAEFAKIMKYIKHIHHTKEVSHTIWQLGGEGEKEGRAFLF